MEYKRNSEKFRKLNLDEKDIIRLYTEEKKTCKEIGGIFNCDLTTIHRRLRNNNINTSLKGKLKSEEHKKNLRKPKSVPNQNKGKTYEELYGKEKGEEITNKNPNKIKFTPEQEKKIIRLYEKELLETRKIGRFFNCGEKPIFRILKKHNINTKHSHRLKLLIEAEKIPRINKGSFKKGMMSGKNNPMYGKTGELSSGWLGGVSFEPYGLEFNNKFRRLIRKRDNYICMKCGKHQEKEGRSLCVHHINYDKKLSIPQNCCALCVNCNTEVNANRKHWIKFFQSLLVEKYNYQYSENQEIILNFEKNRK